MSISCKFIEIESDRKKEKQRGEQPKLVHNFKATIVFSPWIFYFRCSLISISNNNQYENWENQIKSTARYRTTIEYTCNIPAANMLGCVWL